MFLSNRLIGSTSYFGKNRGFILSFIPNGRFVRIAGVHGAIDALPMINSRSEPKVDIGLRLTDGDFELQIQKRGSQESRGNS